MGRLGTLARLGSMGLVDARFGARTFVRLLNVILLRMCVLLGVSVFHVVRFLAPMPIAEQK